MIHGYTLDTNIITALLKGDAEIFSKIEESIDHGYDITINAIVYYEIKRGLEAIRSKKKIEEFENICMDIRVLLIDEKDILDRAANIWANLKQKGQLIEDADILIASIAIVKGYVLVSDDIHFQRVPDLMLENWLK